ncbi:MAG: hypothetical protein AB7I50_03580 [Vicinamibacterales bacterium]
MGRALRRQPFLMRRPVHGGIAEICAFGGASREGVPDLVLRFGRTSINAALGSANDNHARVLNPTGKLGELPSDRVKESDGLRVGVPGQGCRTS